MKILGILTWVEIRLSVNLISDEGPVLGSPWLYLALSEYNGCVQGCKMSLRRSELIRPSGLNLYEPLSRKRIAYNKTRLVNERDNGMSLYAEIGKRYFGACGVWVVNEFESRFYRWPYYGGGAQSNRLNVSWDDLGCWVRICICDINDVGGKESRKLVLPF